MSWAPLLDWPAIVSLVEFAIMDSASPLGSGCRDTPFYADAASVPAASMPDRQPWTSRGQARTLLTSRGAAAIAAGHAQGGASGGTCSLRLGTRCCMT